MSRQRIIAEINFERECQVSQGFTESNDDFHSPDVWIALLARHVGLAARSDGGVGYDLDRYRRQLVRIAALSIAAIESLDRQHPSECSAGPAPEVRGKGF